MLYWGCLSLCLRQTPKAEFDQARAKVKFVADYCTSSGIASRNATALPADHGRAAPRVCQMLEVRSDVEIASTETGAGIWRCHRPGACMTANTCGIERVVLAGGGHC